MGVKVIHITCLLLFIGGSVAPPPKQQTPQQGDSQDLLKLIAAQNNAASQSSPSPPATTANTANSNIAQVTSRVMQGKDAVMNTIKKKKTKEELVTELNNDMIPTLERSIVAAKLLLTNAPEKTQEELDTELKLIKNDLKNKIMGPSALMSQVNKAKDGIQGVINNPSSVKDFKVVQDVTNHPKVQAVVNHPKTQEFITHPYTQKVQEMARPWIDKIWKRDTPQTVM